MTQIDRYVARTFLSSYLILLTLGITVYIFFDIVVNLDEFVGEDHMSLAGGLWKMVDYHGYRLPLYFQQLGGVMMAIAAAFTFAMMLRNNELAPLAAAGMPLQRLLVPILTCSIGLMAVWLINSEVVIPNYATKIARRLGDLDDVGARTVRCVRDDNNAILVADELHARQRILRGVYIIEPDAQRRPSQLIRADVARWDPERRTWDLERGSRLVMAGAFDAGMLGVQMRWEAIDAYPFGLSPEQILLRQSSQWSELMSIRQMNGLLEARNLPNLPAVAHSRDVRFVQPLVLWILILLAAPAFLTARPENVLAAGGRALLVTAGCFGFTFIVHGMGGDGTAARVAAAIPVLIFGPVAVVYLANVKT